MRKVMMFLIVFSLLLSLCACAQISEANGVPQQQIARDLNFGTLRRIISCEHDVDTAIHEDVVLVKSCEEHKYVRINYETTVTYRYDRSNDIWSLEHSNRYKEPEFVATDAIKHAYFSGTREFSKRSVQYNVAVEETESSDGWIVISYDIYLDGEQYSGMTSFVYYGDVRTEWVYAGDRYFNFYLDYDNGISIE